MIDAGTDNHVVHSRGTLSALTGRFSVTPLAKTLARVGAGAVWMRGGGLHGRPPLEEARPVTRLSHIGRFFVTPLAKALARVGAGAVWMRGGGLHGRPPLSNKFFVTPLAK